MIENLKNIRDGKNRTRTALSIGEIYEYDVESAPKELDRFYADCDFVFNLAGVNRPKDPAEFKAGNYGFASRLLETLKKHGNKVKSDKSILAYSSYKEIRKWFTVITKLRLKRL